jgi:orotidine-5'-phosphate decarboxylase
MSAMNETWLERVALALDLESASDAEDLLARLEPRPLWVKVGLQLFTREGPDVLAHFKQGGYRVFADLKLHDIPNTVRGAARAVAARGADLVNVHASGGEAMMRAALEGAREGSEEGGVAAGGRAPEGRSPGEPPAATGVRSGAGGARAGSGGTRVVAVTLLTSLGPSDLVAIEGSGATADSLRERVVRLALLARKAGLNGVVASPGETAAIRKACGPGSFIVTPGIRPGGADPGDQKRIAAPAEAIRAGSDLLVVGRAVTASKDPAAAWRALGLEMAPPAG